jgi:hypothetical protein
LRTSRNSWKKGFFTLDVMAVGNTGRFLAQVPEVGAGDLQRVEHEGGALGVDLFFGEQTDDLEESVLQAHGVLDHAQGEVGLAVSAGMKDAVIGAAAGGSGAGVAVHLDVPTTWSVIEFGNGHRLIPPPGG